MSDYGLVFLPVQNDLVIAYSSAGAQPDHEHLHDICRKAHPEAFGLLSSLFRDWKKVADDAKTQPIPTCFTMTVERLSTRQIAPTVIFALRHYPERNCVVTQQFQLNR